MRNQHLQTNARRLRANMTDAERKLWSALRIRQLGQRFRRQVVIGPYIVDFACLERHLIVELDGGQHLDSEDDRVRDDFLKQHGWYVLRFWNDRVLQETEAVLEVILLALTEDRAAPPSRPPPASGGRGSNSKSGNSPPVGEARASSHDSLCHEARDSNNDSLPRATGEGQGGGDSGGHTP